MTDTPEPTPIDPPPVPSESPAEKKPVTDDAALRAEVERIIMLRRMSDQERCQLCLNELRAVYLRWQCVPNVQSKVENGVVTVMPGIQALPV